MRFPALDQNALLVAGAYLLATTTWIIGSDALVEAVAGGDLAVVQRLQMVKGIGFMVATALGLYALVASSLARQRRQAEELRRVEEMLSVSQRLEALGTLSATVVHDFNNVITIIRGMSDLARLEGYDPARMPMRMHEIEKATDQANHIVRQLTQVMHHAPQAFAPGELAPVIIEFEAMLRQALGRRVTLRIELSAAAGVVIDHDRCKVEQILLNLAVNARDAMEGRETCELTISGRPCVLRDHGSFFQPGPVSGEFFLVTVADTGCGIPPENMERIFDPFFTTKPEGKGTGLGLASVRRLMDQHQGWVEADSRPGEGTRFHLYFPRASRRREAA